MHEDRLTALDAGFLQAEDSDGHASLAVAALAIVEGPPPSFADVVAALEQRTAGLPRCRQVLQVPPLDIGPPRWVPATAFDVNQHVRRVAVTGSGDDAALFDLVADLMERRLHRSRPLWESWVIEGLAGDRWAILTKVHHCVADGMSAMAMLTDMCDPDPIRDHRVPAVPEPPSRAVASVSPFTRARTLVRTGTAAAQNTLRIVRGASQVLGGLAFPTPQSMAGPLGDLRRFSAARVSMADVQLVCRRFDVTVNDVALAAITEAFRTTMSAHDMTLRADSMRTLVPVSLRSADALHTPDNRVSLLLPLLPVDEADPVQRLRKVHGRLATAKAGGQRQAGSLAVAAANLVPYPVMAAAVRLLTRLPQRGVVTVATNVPGPVRRVRLLGREVVEVIPVPPIAVGLRTGIAIMSYADQLAFGVLGDYDAVIGAEELARGVQTGLQRLVTIAGAARRSRRSGNLLLLHA